MNRGSLKFSPLQDGLNKDWQCTRDGLADLERTFVMRTFPATVDKSATVMSLVALRSSVARTARAGSRTGLLPSLRVLWKPHWAGRVRARMLPTRLIVSLSVKWPAVCIEVIDSEDSRLIDVGTLLLTQSTPYSSIR